MKPRSEVIRCGLFLGVVVFFLGLFDNFPGWGSDAHIDRERLLRTLQGPVTRATPGAVAAYLEGIDDFVLKALNAGVPAARINSQLATLKSIDLSAPSPSYILKVHATSHGLLAFGVYNLSYEGPSSLRVYAKRGNQYSTLFTFLPRASQEESLKAPVELHVLLESEDRLSFAALIGGSTSGFAPPLDLVGWNLDLRKLEVKECLVLTAKAGLNLLPLDPASGRLILRWCNYTGNPSDCDLQTEAWFDTEHGFKLVALYCVTMQPLPPAAGLLRDSGKIECTRQGPTP